MKIMIVGDGHSSIHEVAVAAAFEQLNHTTYSFFWHSYFQSSYPWARIWLRAQNKFLIGPSIKRLNRDLIQKAVEFQPSLIFIYRGTHVTRLTLSKLKKLLPGCKFFGYNNDDPFADGHQRWIWRHFKRCVPIYDVVFAYRKHNITEYLDIGAKQVELLMPWFLPWIDKPLGQDEQIDSKYDVVFVGHYENDGRLKYLQRVAESNFVFGLFGPDWHLAPKLHWLKLKQPIIPVRGKLYRETLVSAKIALCFLSKLNRDVYTRRCFEIPAMGVCMFCEYTDELSHIFRDGRDVVFFRTPDEMLEKLDYYIRNNRERAQVAANGRKRVLRDKHDILSRMNYVMSFVK